MAADCSTEGSTRRPRAACRPTGSNEGARAVPNPPYGLDGQALPRPSLRPPGFAWSYTWTKTTLQRAGLVSKAPRRGAHRRRRPRKPCVGMMLHQDGSRHEWLAGQAACDLIVTMDDATSETIRLPGRGGRHRVHLPRAEAGVHRQGLPGSLYTDRGSHYFHTPEAGGKVAGQHTQVGRALHQLGIEHIAAYSPEARGRSSAPCPGPPRQGTGAGGDRDGRSRHRFIADTYLPDHNRRFATPPELDDRPSAPRPPRPGATTSSACTQSAQSPATTPCATKGASRSPPPQPDTTRPSRPGSGSTRSIQTVNPRPLPRAPMPRPLPGRR